MASTTACILDPSCVKFADPKRVQLANNTHYHVQEALYNGQELHIISDWFESEGPRDSKYAKKPEMLVKVEGNLSSCLSHVEAEARRQVQYPPDVPVEVNKIDTYFRCANLRSYTTLHSHCQSTYATLSYFDT